MRDSDPAPEGRMPPQPPVGRQPRHGERNKLAPEDSAAHDWYRFVLAFPPHLVRDYLEKFHLTAAACVCDPFCGTGTTVVECKKRGIPSIGIEANAFAHFAGQVKTDWTIDPDGLLQASQAVAAEALAELERHGIADAPLFPNMPQPDAVPLAALRALEPASAALLLKNSISPRPLHKVLVLRDCLRRHRDTPYFPHQMLAFAKAVTFSISNVTFGPEVGVGRAKTDVPVVAPWLAGVTQMAHDVRQLAPQRTTPAQIQLGDARNLAKSLLPETIDAVITSPPYPNEKDYTRTTRLELVLLGFISSKAELQALKRRLVRSNTRGVYTRDDDDQWVAHHPEIQRIAAAIEARRVELGKTSGFERLYARVTRLYFGGMARHLAELRPRLRPGALLGYVVGDQASYLQVMIRTGQLLADIADSLGYEVVAIDLFRTRLATATKAQLREEVVVLRWPGTTRG